MKATLKNLYLSLISSFLVVSAFAADNYDQALAKLRSYPDNYAWVQERSLDNLNFPNMILCMIRQTAAANLELINTGAYVVSVLDKSCDKDGITDTLSLGQSSPVTVYNKGVMKSTHDVANNRLIFNFWMPPGASEIDHAKQRNDQRKVTYTFATVIVNNPNNNNNNEIGFSEVYWTGFDTDLTTLKPKSTSQSDRVEYGSFLVTPLSGGGYNLSMVSWQNNIWSPNGGGVEWLNLTRTGSKETVNLYGTTQKIVWDQNATPNAYGNRETIAKYLLNANNQEFLRKTYNGVTNQWGAAVCFDRTTPKSNTWNYTLYSDTGVQKDVNSMIELRYTDNSGKTYNGNFQNNNVWFENDVLFTIGANKTAAVKALKNDGTSENATLTMKDGGLQKVTLVQTPLSSLKDTPLDYWNCTNGNCSNVKISWSTVNNVTAFYTVDSSTLVRTNTLFTNFPTWNNMWVNTNGTSYVLKVPVNNSNQPQWNTLNNSSLANSRQQRNLTQVEMSEIEASGDKLLCINNCPMWNADKSQIDGFTASTAYVSGVINNNNRSNNNNSTWGGNGWSYKIVNGNLVNEHAVTGGQYYADPLIYTTLKKQVLNSDGTTDYGKGYGSSALVRATAAGASTKLASMANAVAQTSVCGNNNSWCPWNYEDTLVGTSFYIWQTGEMQWNKSWALAMSNGQAPILDNQMNVTYTCPAGRSECNPGAKYILNYNGPGKLWGVPNKCVDQENYNTTCDSNTKNTQWINKFNLSKSPVDVDSNDFVTMPDPSNLQNNLTFKLLPNGSNIYYPVKNCTLPEPDETPAVNLSQFKAEMIDFSAAPLDTTVEPPTVVQGSIIRHR